MKQHKKELYHKGRFRHRWIKGLLSLSLLLSQPSIADWLTETTQVMGTEAKITLWHDSTDIGRHLIKEAFVKLQAVDQQMSPYVPSSELYQLNEWPINEAKPLSPELLFVLEQAEQFSKLTNGAFDITFASIGHQYDYRKKRQPDAKTVTALLPLINFEHIEIRQKTIIKHRAVTIDLGGIAKGYSVDRAAQFLRSKGIQSASISAGGDTQFIGDRQGRPWYVGIRHPRSGRSAHSIDNAVVLPLENTSISTSGDYQRYFIADGTRHHHIIQPKTGLSPKEVISVSVIGPDSITTDALATALMVMGVEKGLELVESQSVIDAIFIDQHGKMHYSSNLAAPSNEETPHYATR